MSKGPFLEIIAKGMRSEIKLDQPRITIGRQAANHVVVDDQRASRAHCVIEQTRAGFLVRDLGSSNGTLLNGERVEGAVELNPGDVINIGMTTLKYLISNEEEPEVLGEQDIVAEEDELVPIENEFAE